MSDLLRMVPGVDVVAAGPPGGQQSIFLRGANSQHTKVMVDGIPINDPSGPSRAFDAANFSLDNVERIEVLQGPQSLLYGSEAIGGVINIITKRGEGPLGGSVQAEGGAYGTHREAARVSGGNELIDYSEAQLGNTARSEIAVADPASAPGQPASRRTRGARRPRRTSTTCSSNARPTRIRSTRTSPR
jgi:vitamin B12 transporter